MISTGRPFRASKRYYDELNMDTPVVNFNGAYVHHPKDTHFPTQHSRLDEGIATCIIDTLKTMNVQNMIAEVMDQVYLDRYDENLFEGFSMGEANIQVGDLRKLLKEDPTSLLIEADEHQIPRIKRYSHGFTLKILNTVVGVPLFQSLKLLNVALVKPLV